MLRSRRRFLVTHNTDNTIAVTVTELPAQIESLTEVYNVLDDFWQQVDALHTSAPVDIVYHALTTAAMEIAANIVRHAYRDGEDGTMRIELRLLPQRIEITFYDYGIEFNQEPVDPVIDPDLAEFLPEGGLGLFLVRRSVDEMHYQREDGENRWLLVKKLA